MQRIPAKTVPGRIADHASEPSPLLKLARRIREEQGAEQTRAFLSAMLPFAAPGEIRRVGEGFGIPFESISGNPPAPKAQPEYGEKMSPANEAADRLRMLQTIMQLSGASRQGGPDIGKLLGLLGGLGGRQ